MIVAPVGIETTAVTDAAQLLADARANLYAQPPTLERMALARGLDAMATRSWTPNFKTIDGGVLIMTPPVLWTQLLIEARRLGVL
jgi:hypothetical protein